MVILSDSSDYFCPFQQGLSGPSSSLSMSIERNLFLSRNDHVCKSSLTLGSQENAVVVTPLRRGHSQIVSSLMLKPPNRALLFVILALLMPLKGKQAEGILLTATLSSAPTQCHLQLGFYAESVCVCVPLRKHKHSMWGHAESDA